jgi:glutamate racemase
MNVCAHAAIGVFDSGLGGLSVLKAIRAELPAEDVLYFADSGYAPYGDRDEAFIVDRAMTAVAFLVQRGAKAVVIACNTATVVAARQLREAFGIPIVAMEPAIKPAVELSRNKVVGVLATSRTVASPSVASLVARYGQGADVRLQACPGLVAQVEQGDLDGLHTRELVAQYLAPLLAAGADTLVLGCTHYPFLLPVIQELAGPDVRVVESSAAVAREIARRTQNLRHPLDGIRMGATYFYTTADPVEAQMRITALWGQPVLVQPVLPDHNP